MRSTDARKDARSQSEAQLREALAGHMTEVFGQQVTITALRRISAGFSWITQRFETLDSRGERRDLILRIAPENGLFAPYSVMPQVRALRVLAETAVPVPELISWSDDGTLLGAPFFVSTFVSGIVAAPWNYDSTDIPHRKIIAEQFINVLADLHRIDDVGPIAALASDSAVDRVELRSIRRWSAVVDRPSRRRYPSLTWAARWFVDHCPQPPRISIVHGDYRIGNFLEDEARIAAILDWELVHAGDPHEDLGWALLPTFNGGSRKLYGALARDEVLERYAKRSGISIEAKSIAFYEAYAMFQAATIQLCGMQAFESGRFIDMRMAAMAMQMAPMVRALDKALETIA